MTVSWLALSLTMLIIGAINTLLCKLNNVLVRGDDLVCAFCAMFVTGVIAGCFLVRQRKRVVALAKKSRWMLWLSLLGIVVTNLVGWVVWVRALRIAPNPGLVHAIANADVVLVVLLSSLFFKSTLTPRVMLGVVCVAVGVVLAAR